MLCNELRQHTNRRTFVRKEAERVEADLCELQQTEVELREQIAVLTAELTSLHTAEANRLRREDRERRATFRESSSTVAQLAAAEKRERAAAAAAEKARGEAALAKAELANLSNAVRLAEGARDAAEGERDTIRHEALLLRRRLERAFEKLEQAPRGLPSSRSAHEWAALSRNAERLAAWRARACLKELLEGHEWRAEDIALALHELGYLQKMFDTKHVMTEHLKQVRALLTTLEPDHFGEGFGLFLHYEMHLTLDKILRITQAASKHFHCESDRDRSKVLFYNPFVSRDFIKVPRICPSPSKLAPLIRRFEDRLGVAPAEDGRLAFKPYKSVVQELLASDPGTGDMPELPFFTGGSMALPLVISFDATGFGSQQVNTIALNNPFSSKSAQQLRSFGHGNCSDDRSGTTRLLGDNINYINARLAEERLGVLGEFEVGSLPLRLQTKTYIVLDVSTLHHSASIYVIRAGAAATATKPFVR